MGITLLRIARVRNHWLLPPPLSLKHFATGVTAAATCAIAGAVLVLEERAALDIRSATISAGALGAILAWRRLSELVILLAGGVGLLMHGAKQLLVTNPPRGPPARASTS